MSALSLESSRWSELSHAYGPAIDIPPLLAMLSELPTSAGDSEPWFSLWSALAHQGDVYDASFAAVPHVIEAMSTSPGEVDYVYFQFPAWVEICRKKKGIEVPPDLSPGYFQALNTLPALVAAASNRDWSPDFLQCALSAIAAVKGKAEVAETIQGLTPAVAENFLEWFYEH
jgi:hypothetical protein